MKLDRDDDSWMDIWMNRRNAPPEEKWKWDSYIWVPILERILAGEVDHLACPVCGNKSVYYRFLAVHEFEWEGKTRIMAERWVGCESCGVQVHDRGLLPDWIEDPEWVLGPERRRKHHRPDGWDAPDQS